MAGQNVTGGVAEVHEQGREGIILTKLDQAFHGDRRVLHEHSI